MKFSVAVEPVPQPRPRFSKNRTYQPARVIEYKNQIKLAAIAAMKGAPPIESAVTCVIRLWRKFKPTSRRYGDFDNLAKAICDALNGVAFKDDSQIVACSVEKFQSENPRVEVEISAQD